MSQLEQHSEGSLRQTLHKFSVSKQSNAPSFCLYVEYLIYLSLSVSTILFVCSYMALYEKYVFVQVYHMHGIPEILLIQIQGPFIPIMTLIRQQKLN